jgi:hypothetical protein
MKSAAGREGRGRGKGEREGGGGWLLPTIGVLCLIVVHESPMQGPLTQRHTVAAVTTIREPTNHSLDGKTSNNMKY